jgi:hypothetical protein
MPCSEIARTRTLEAQSALICGLDEFTSRRFYDRSAPMVIRRRPTAAVLRSLRRKILSLARFSLLLLLSMDSLRLLIFFQELGPLFVRRKLLVRREHG